MPATQRRRWTAAEVRALPEEPGKTYEVIDGELFVSAAPAWSHQRIAVRIWQALDAHVRVHRFADVLIAPAEIEPDPHTLVQPDVLVVPLVAGRKPRDWWDAGRLILAVEVLSPSSGRRDRVVKRELYRRMGAECWIVDPDARVVERWRPGEERPEVLDRTIGWQAEGVSEPLVLDLRSVFAEALGEE